MTKIEEHIMIQKQIVVVSGIRQNAQYSGTYKALRDDKHRFVRDSSLCILEIQDNV